REHGNGEAGGLCEASENVTVAAVVSAAADDDDAVRRGPSGAQIAERRLSRALHQRVARHAENLDRVTIQSTDLRCRVEKVRQCHGVIILAAGALSCRKLSHSMSTPPGSRCWRRPVRTVSMPWA